MLRVISTFALFLFAGSLSHVEDARASSNEAFLLYKVSSERPKFVYDTFAFADNDRQRGRLNLVVEFVNDLLQFERIDGAFIGEYEIVVEIINQDGVRCDGVIIREHLAATTFAETNSRTNVTRHHWTFTAQPGFYSVFIDFTDHVTGRHLVRHSTAVVQDYSEPVALSDLAFVDKRAYDADGLVLSAPNLLRTWQSADSDFGTFLEIYSNQPDSVWLNYRVYGQTGERLLNRDENIAVNGRTTKIIPLKQLVWWPGSYVLVVEARSGTCKASKRSTFRIEHWEPSRVFLEKERESYTLAAMRYIADSDEFKALFLADSAADEQRLDLFWQERDPSPGDARNELRDEFQERVDYSVKHFSNFSISEAGSDSDRGRIHILYGIPSEKKRLQLRQGGRMYEFWYYKKLDRRFIFVDPSGLGSFQLIHKD